MPDRDIGNPPLTEPLILVWARDDSRWSTNMPWPVEPERWETNLPRPRLWWLS